MRAGHRRRDGPAWPFPLSDAGKNRGRLGTGAVWHDGAFMLFWLARTVSGAGTAITTVVLPLHVYELTGSALQTSLLTSPSVVPYLAQGPLADEADQHQSRQAGLLLGLAQRRCHRRVAIADGARRHLEPGRRRVRVAEDEQAVADRVAVGDVGEGSADRRRHRDGRLPAHGSRSAAASSGPPPAPTLSPAASPPKRAAAGGRRRPACAAPRRRPRGPQR